MGNRLVSRHTGNASPGARVHGAAVLRAIVIAFTLLCLVPAYPSAGFAARGFLEPHPLAGDNISGYDGASYGHDDILLAAYGTALHYNPSSIGLYAVKHYANYYLTGSTVSLDRFLHHARWLEQNLTMRQGYGVWEYDFPYAPYKANPPWVSALSQGWGISTMVEAWKLTGNESYLRAAESALGAFNVSAFKGGIKAEWPDDSVWYEEYPSTPESHVLNGFIFSLAGVLNLYKATGNGEAKRIFDEGVASLKRHLADYDTGFTSLYDQHARSKATAGSYHLVHVHQLLWLYYATGDTFFYQYAKKWLNYDTGFVSGASASSTLEPKTHGPGKLADGIKYYGDWSSNLLPVTIVLDMGKPVRDIEAIVFYATSPAAMPRAFTVSVSSDGRRWSTALNVNGARPQIRGYNKTGNYETVIGGYRLGTRPDARYVAITVRKARGLRITGLREVDVHFDQTSNINGMYGNLLKYFQPIPATSLVQPASAPSPPATHTVVLSDPQPPKATGR